VHIVESKIPVEEAVRGACEILGLDPLYLANEGRFIAILPQKEAETALGILRKHTVSSQAQQIGNVRESPASLVTLENLLGTTRILDMERGEPLPRIC